MGILFSDLENLTIPVSNMDIGYGADCENTTEELANLIQKYKGSVVVVTGAGISSHQLPTFRAENGHGLWKSFSQSILSKSNFNDNPDPCWQLIANVRQLQVDRKLHPSLSHYILHNLLVRGFIQKIITQNIDSLHCYKGDEERIVELHGYVSDYGICENCKTQIRVPVLDIIQTKKSPRCPVCDSILKPPVAFFGDIIPGALRKEASSLLNNANVVVLIGTHCTVDPILSMVLEAKRVGAILVEINISKTTASRFADMSLMDKSDNILSVVSRIVMPDLDIDNVNLEKWQCYKED
jgi:NAD-dependent deacetylase